jgi:hypothetical protein
MPEVKVAPQHLERDAYLYIRQSTPRQVLENAENTQRQYALRDRAVVLGWPLERIHVLDCDLGKSGSQSTGRDGRDLLGLTGTRQGSVRSTGTGRSPASGRVIASPEVGGLHYRHERRAA